MLSVNTQRIKFKDFFERKTASDELVDTNYTPIVKFQRQMENLMESILLPLSLRFKRRTISVNVSFITVKRKSLM